MIIIECKKKTNLILKGKIKKKQKRNKGKKKQKQMLAN
jgi:hypothetical protein